MVSFRCMWQLALAGTRGTCRGWMCLPATKKVSIRNHKKKVSACYKEGFYQKYKESFCLLQRKFLLKIQRKFLPATKKVSIRNTKIVSACLSWRYKDILVAIVIVIRGWSSARPLPRGGCQLPALPTQVTTLNRCDGKEVLTLAKVFAQLTR